MRQALTDGVGFQEMIGVNPYKLGIVAGADAHTAFSVNEEFNYTGSWDYPANLVKDKDFVKKATYKNTIGDSELSAVWTDPDFEASQLNRTRFRIFNVRNDKKGVCFSYTRFGKISQSSGLIIIPYLHPEVVTGFV